MSRIEEALERAMRIKESEAGRPPVPAPKSAPLEDAEAAPAPFASPAKVRGYPSAASGSVRIQNAALVTITDPTSPVAEEYRKLKEMVLKATRTAEGFRNTLMVTSALAGEGKTVTSLNLAACLAQEYDHTVLVVDADLRKPSCAKYLGIEPGPGISDCLLKGTPFSEALIHTGIGKLAFLPAGSPVDNPAELFSSHRMRDLLMEMKHRYPDRYIVIDTPPVLPFAETRTLGAIADGVILVVKEGVPSQDEIRESVDALRGATILGIVYNQADLSGINKPYSNYYYDRYRR
jgi:protein-tyrosine kinase